MRTEVLDLLTGYFSEEMVEERPSRRTSLYNGGATGVERVRAEFRALLTSRSLSRDEFYRATMAYFTDEASMYRELEDVYRFFFDDEPPTRSE